MTLAIIPARGGSKRIPRKNIKAFVGKPLIVYSLEAAHQSGVFEHILVSTDDAEIAQVARDYGATDIVMRPAELADDVIGTSPVVRHAIESFQAASQQTFDYACCIYATAPFLSGKDLAYGFERLASSPQSQFALSVTSFEFPIQRALRFVDGGVAPLDPPAMSCRSQDFEPYYHDAGQFYWGRCQSWLTRQAVFAPHSIPIELPRYRVQDIDSAEDWVRAELMYRAYLLSRGDTPNAELSISDSSIPDSSIADASIDRSAITASSEKLSSTGAASTDTVRATNPLSIRPE